MYKVIFLLHSSLRPEVLTHKN